MSPTVQTLSMPPGRACAGGCRWILPPQWLPLHRPGRWNAPLPSAPGPGAESTERAPAKRLTRAGAEELGQRIQQQAALIAQASCDVLLQIAGFDARERLRVARALPGLPLTIAESGAGRPSCSTVREITRVADRVEEVRARWPALFEPLINQRSDTSSRAAGPDAVSGDLDPTEADPEWVAATTGGEGFSLAGCVQALCSGMIKSAA